MGRNTIDRQIHSSLANKVAFGSSKHLDKENKEFGYMSQKIFSRQTYATYRKVGEEYAKWLVENQGLKRYVTLKKTEEYAAKYLRERLEKGISPYTLKMERAALGKIYGKSLDIPLPKRDNKAITRSRGTKEMDKHISPTGKYRDVFTFAQATGCRRKDLGKATAKDLLEINGRLYLKITKSKGGRDRLAPVLPSKAEEVRRIVQEAKEQRKDVLFAHIPKTIDVHAQRRCYARELYNTVAQDKAYKEDLLACYQARREAVKSTTYRDRDGNSYYRDDVYCVSQALGHNRLDVTITHYLK